MESRGAHAPTTAPSECARPAKRLRSPTAQPTALAATGPGDGRDGPGMSTGHEEAKVARVDASYFGSYSHLAVHEDMLRDTERTHAYRRAIFAAGLGGKVVVDVGCGTGILSVFCAQAGARHVYAIEASGVAEQARRVVAQNGLQGRITVVQGRVEDVELPCAQVDVIVSEWMGYALLYEGMLDSVVCARKRWLGPRGVMLPRRAVLLAAPVSLGPTWRDWRDGANARSTFWQSIGNEYGLDLSAVAPLAQHCASRGVCVDAVPPESVLSLRPDVLVDIDCREVTMETLRRRRTESFAFKCIADRPLSGLALWFDVHFGVTDESDQDVTLSTAPGAPLTHWHQTILHLDDELEVRQDAWVKGSITISRPDDNQRFLALHVSGKVEGPPVAGVPVPVACFSKSWNMNDDNY